MASAADRPISTPAFGPSTDVILPPGLVALSDGFLAIWREGTQCGTQELHAIRLDHDGQPLDPSSFVIAQTLPNSGVIAAAADGDDTYVVFPNFGLGSYLVRVGGDGTVTILSASIPVTGIQEIHFSGDNLVLVGSHQHLADPLTATLVDRSGVVVRSGVTLAGTQVREKVLVASNDALLLGWIGDDGLHSTSITPAQLAADNVPAAPLVLSATGMAYLGLASDGEHAMATWLDVSTNTLRMLPLSSTGTPTGGTVTIGSFVAVQPPTVVAVNDGYEILLRDASNPGDPQLIALYVSFEGGLLALYRYPAIMVQPSMTVSGDRAIALWSDKRFATSKGTEVVAGAVNTDGSVGPGSIVSLSPVEQHVRKFLPFAGGVAALWTDSIPNDRVVIGRLTPAGEPVDGPGIYLRDSIYDQGHSAIATDGERLFIVWTEGDSNVNQTLYGAIVSFAGSPSVTVKQLANDAGGASDLAVNWNGQTFTIVYQRTRTGSYDFAALRVDRSGNAVDPTPIVLMPASATDENPRLSWSGSDYLVVWQRAYDPFIHFGDPCTEPHGPLPAELFARRFSVALAPIGAVVDLATTTNHNDVLLDIQDDDVSFNAGMWLVVWHDNKTTLTMYARIDTSGSRLDPLGGRQLPGFVEHPIIIPTADGWTVAGYEGPGPHGSGRGLATARVGLNGLATALTTLPLSGISDVEAVALTPVPLVAYKRPASAGAFIGLLVAPRSRAVVHR